MQQTIKPDLSPDQVDVFGIRMLSSVDLRQLNGVTATEEPCLHGYERTFDSLDVIVGYGFDSRIRKITTRNPSTSIYGVRPGTPLATGVQKLRQAGWHEHDAPFTFRTGNYSLRLLVDQSSTIFGMTIEILQP